MGICKASIFCILAILKENSDENHILEMKDIIGKMRALYGISIDRRTVTSDLPQTNAHQRLAGHRRQKQIMVPTDKKNHSVKGGPNGKSHH